MLVDAALPIELATPTPSPHPSPYDQTDSPPVLAAAGAGRRSIPPHIPTSPELDGIYKRDPTTGHPAQATNTVTKVAQRELLRSVKQGEYIGAATLCAHLLRAAYQLGWESAPVLSQALGGKGEGDGRGCFAFVPVVGEEKQMALAGEVRGSGGREEVKMATTSGNSGLAVCAKSAVVRQYIQPATSDSIGHIFASLSNLSSVPRGLLHTLLEVVNIQPTKAGGCEVVLKVDPGLFYCLPRVSGLEFVEWGSAVDAGRAGRMFERFSEVDEAVEAERMFEMIWRGDGEEAGMSRS